MSSPNHQERLTKAEDAGAKPDSGDTSSESSLSDSKPWMKLAGMGMELASYSLGFAAIGYAFDRYQNQGTRYGVAAGVLIGFAFGMFRFIQKAMREIQNQYK